jgi:hypothetical protein
MTKIRSVFLCGVLSACGVTPLDEDRQPQEKPAIPPTSTSPCPPTTVTPTAAPALWDMEGVFPGYGQNLMTPVDDQFNRGSCWVFAQVSQLEMEYARQYGLSHTAAQTTAYAQSLVLSKEYFIDMTSIVNTGPVYSEYAATPPAPIPANGATGNWLSVADQTDFNQTCGGTPLIGLPPRADWHNVERDAASIYPMMQSMPLDPGGSPMMGPDDAQTFFDTFGVFDPPSVPMGGDLSNGLSYGFNLALANFYWDNTGSASPQTSAYPPPSVHEDARYAPMAVEYMAVYMDGDTNMPPAVPLPSQCTMAPHEYPIVTPTSSPSADQAACYDALAAPFETLLSQNHPIVVTTRPVNWDYDEWFAIGSANTSYWSANDDRQTTTQILGFMNSDGTTDMQEAYPLVTETNVDQHFVTLIGYDHDRQAFHFKNEWGTGQGTGQGSGVDGTFWMTYDLLFRTILTEPDYIDGVWDPTNALAGTSTSPYPAPAPIPNGNWFGFWQGEVNGIAGIAFIGHFPSDSRIANVVSGQSQGQIGNPVGEFYFSDGSPTLEFQMNGWDSTPTTYTGYFATRTTGEPLFSLTATFGSTLPEATWTSATPSTPAAEWSKCGTAISGSGVNGTVIGAENVEPETYLDILDDPYVLPPCSTAGWHTPPTWTCNVGDPSLEFVSYGLGSDPSLANNEDYVTRLCLTTSTVAPTCPAGTTLKTDLNWIAETNARADSVIPQTLDGCVTSSDTKCLNCTKSDCVTNGPCGWNYYPPSCPTPSGVTPTSYVPWLGGVVSWVDGNVIPQYWANVVTGADTCVSAAYAPTATCPSGYHLSPNGTDCLATVIPPIVRPSGSGAPM